MGGTQESQHRQREQQQRELRLLEQFFADRTSTTAEVHGVTSLCESLPDTFAELAHQYAGLLDRGLERQVYKVDHKISEGLRLLAEELGLLKADPRDVLAIHIRALKAEKCDAASEKAEAYAEEARLLVLELMGYLASYYRNAFLGTAKGKRPMVGGPQNVRG